MQKEISSRLDLRQNEWIEYEDDNGKGFAQPDGFVVIREFVFLFECKLTGGPAGKEQMLDTYVPLLEHMFERPVRSLLVCKWRTPDTPGPFVENWIEFLRSGHSYACWNWMP